MQIKYNYKNEVIKKSDIIIAIILVIIIFGLTYIGINQVISDGWENIGPFIMFEIILTSMSALSVYHIYKTKINRENAKEIVEKGVKVPGKIIDIKEFLHSYTDTQGTTQFYYYYYLIVEYTNNGIKYTIESPELNFNPQCLSSKEVDVYLYKNNFYIDNFILVPMKK